MARVMVLVRGTSTLQRCCLEIHRLPQAQEEHVDVYEDNECRWKVTWTLL